jgi:hypothetical protein
MPTETEYEKTEFITTDQLIGRALDRGITLGPQPHQTINLYIQRGLVPQLINGMHPATAVARVISIDSMLHEGKSLEEIQEVIRKERRSFLRRAVDLTSLVNTYNNSTFKSLLMLSSLFVLAVLSIVVVTSVSPASKTFAGGVVHEAAKPIGVTLAAIIRQAKPENENSSTDPLGLTNISKVITINEKQQVVLEKTVSVASPTTEISSNLNADKVDNADAGTGAGDVLLLDNSGNIDISGEIKGSKFTGDGSGLTNLSLPNTLLYSNQPYANPSWLTSLAWSKLASRPSLITSVDGVSNDLGDIDFVAGTGVTITPNDTNNTITFNLAGSGVNADLLDGIDSTQFLRSDTADSFTSGTLTMAGGTTLNILGAFSCTDCVSDTAVANTITASNYLPLAGGTLAGNIDFNNNLALNIGNAGTDFTATGGLNLADAITFSGDTNLYRVAANVLATDDDLRVIGNDIQGSGGSSLIDLSARTLQGGAWNVSGSNITTLFTGTSSITRPQGGSLTEDTIFQATLSNATDDVSREIGFKTNISSVAEQIQGFSATLDSNYAAANDAIGLIVQINANNSFTLDRATGIYINNPGGTGTLWHNYGIRIADMEKGTTSNYAIYSEGGNSYHAGNLYLGRLPSGNDTLYKLVVSGSLCVDDSTPSCAAAPTAGAIYVENSVGAGNVSAFDISEYYPATEPTEKGDLVSAAGNSAVKRSSRSYDPGLLGIVSTDPALVIDETSITFGKTAGDNFNPLKPYVALDGRVPVKVSTENGPIEPGDPLTSSSLAGVAMKATRSGPIVGKALEAYSGSGVDKIMVFVSVGWYVDSIETTNTSQVTSFSSIDIGNLSANNINTQILMIGDRKLSMLTDGSLSIDGNTEIAGSLKVAGAIDTKNLSTDELEIGAKSSGQTTLAAGTKEVEVKTGVVKDGSEIFITFNSDYSPATRYWITKNISYSFTLHLNAALDKNASFSWLLIN